MKTRKHLLAIGILLAAVGSGCPQPFSTTGGQLKSIAAGGGHTLALKSDGSLWAWGANGAGQLGIGATPDVVPATNVPVRVGSEHDWIAASAGDIYSLALKADGSLWAWGDNIHGELGNIAIDHGTNVPARIGMENNWLSVDAGLYNALALKTDGSLWAWGNGSQAGPVRIGTENDWTSISMTVGGLALKTDGTMWNLMPERIGIGHDWLMVAGGSYVDPLGGPSLFGTHHLALMRDGSLWAWGNNSAGELGDGTTEYRLTPVPIGSDHDWVAIAAGGFSSAALKGDGTLWRWGFDYEGGASAVPVQLGNDDGWVAVETSGRHTVGLKADGSLWAWGGNWSGQLGIGTIESTNIPVRIGADNDWAVPPPLDGELRITVLAIAADGRLHVSFTHTNYRAYYVLYRGAEPTNIQQAVQVRLADLPPIAMIDPTPVSSNANAFYRICAVPVSQPLDLDGDGIDDVYELRHARFLNPLNASDAQQDSDGDGRSNLREYHDGTNPAQDTGERHVVAASPNHIVVLKTDGSLWAWGDNSFGQLGDGTYENREAPVRVGTDTDWISVATGPGLIEGNTIGLKGDGSLWAWGGNSWGQLGTGGGNAPARLGLDNDWSAVAVGLFSTVALKRDGSLWTWGNGTDVPTRIGSDSDWSIVAAGFSHNLALKTDGSLWAWGENQFGQCGLDQGFSGASEPTRVGTFRGWTAIAAGENHSLALKADGSLWAWGLGPTGLGSGSHVFTPTRVGADTGWAAVAASRASLARKLDGSLWVWGLPWDENEPTRLGTGSDWRAFAAGGLPSDTQYQSFAVALQRNGSLWFWPSITPADLTPHPVGTDTDWGSPP